MLDGNVYASGVTALCPGARHVYASHSLAGIALGDTARSECESALAASFEISTPQQVHQDQTCRDERKGDRDPPARFACERPRLVAGGNGKNNGKNQEEKCDGHGDSHDRWNGWAGVIFIE